MNGYLTSLATKYKEGKINKQMLNKYIECYMNCWEYEFANKRFDNIFFMLSYIYNHISEVLSYARIITDKKELPRLKEGGIVNDNEEIIIPTNDINYIKNDIKSFYVKHEYSKNINLKEILSKQPQLSKNNKLLK